MKQFNEMDHIEMLEREVIHWKGEEEAKRKELLGLQSVNDAFEEENGALRASIDKIGQSLKAKKEALNEANKIRGELKLQLMDKNDKHSEEMKVMYDKLHGMENRWAQAVSTAAEEREIRKSYERDLIVTRKLSSAAYVEICKMEVKLKKTTRQKRHILRAFNDKADEVADLKRYIKQLERENSGLLESVTMLSSHAMAEIERGIQNKENNDVVRKDILYKMASAEIQYSNIERLYKTDFEIYNVSREAQCGNNIQRIVFYTTEKPNVSALGARIEKEYDGFFPQQEIEHTGTIIHTNPRFVLEKMSRGEVLNKSFDKDVLIYRNAVILGSGFVYDGQPLKLFTFESLNGD